MNRKVFLQKFSSITGSRWFFRATLVLFALQSSWIALTGRYPQAFDEQYHFGLIKLHAQQWSPFFATQPAGADQYGAVVRDPDLLYHYLLSFIYRPLSMFIHNEIFQIVLLRFTSVAFIVIAFVLFRRLLLKMGLSISKANILIFFFSLLPVFTLLAGQLSYDTLLLVVTAITLNWLVDIVRTPAQTTNWLLILRLIIAMLLFSTVKYAFLPVFFGVTIVIFVYCWKRRNTLWSEFVRAWLKLTMLTRTMYIIAAVVAVWIFMGSIGLNLVRYHAPSPKCDQVISVQSCMEFGPFARDYASTHNDDHPSATDLAVYPIKWTRNMIRETYFTVYSYFNSEGKPAYYGGQSVYQLRTLGWMIFYLSGIGLVFGLRRLLSRNVTKAVLFVSAIYILSVFYVNIRTYYQTDYVIAVHGRYLFPVIIPFIGCAVLGLGYLLEGVPKKYFEQTKVALIVVMLLSIGTFATQGGGFETYIRYSGDGSFLSEVPGAQSGNRFLRDIFTTTIIGE